MAKIAAELERALARRALAGAPGGVTSRTLARGEGWTAADVLCTAGPRDRAFEERRPDVCIALVAAGGFQYRAAAGRQLMTPGSLLLGNADECFECGHQHGEGDRCLALHYDPDAFDRLARDAGAPRPRFRRLGLPPLRDLAPLVAQGFAGLAGADLAWDELAVRLAARTVQLAEGLAPGGTAAPRGAEARVARIVRTIELRPDADLTLGNLAREAGLSPFHFLRTFERVTGATPHQYVRRARLRDAALRLATGPAKVLDVALDCGFGDLSAFNRAFRAEFGVSPTAWRRRMRG